jgi:lipoprotein-anchoring transpeptidase ErfK/SrfK
MDPMLKWIGGATAAIVLLLGGATLASEILTSPAPAREPIPTLEQAIPVDKAAFEKAPEADPVTEEHVALQPAAAPPAPAPAPKSERFVIKRILPIDGPIKYGEWHWDDEDVPEGPLVITVDLDARVISVFRAGYEIGAAAAMLGTDEHPTPLGTFPILSKERHNVSEKYGNAPMPWTLRLTRDGVAIHGGSEVENGYASHGCIAIPDELASRLFAVAKKGDKVIITRGETMALGDTII